MENSLSYDDMVKIVAKLVLQRLALMQVQSRLERTGGDSDFLIYDRPAEARANSPTLILEVLWIDLIKCLGGVFKEHDVIRSLDALVDDGLITYRFFPKKIAHKKSGVARVYKIFLIELDKNLLSSRNQRDAIKLKNHKWSTLKQAEELLSGRINIDDKTNYAIELRLRVNEWSNSGELLLRFTKTGYTKRIKRFNSINDTKSATLQLTQWVLGEGYNNGPIIDISEKRKELKYSKTGSGFAAEIIRGKYKPFRKVFIPQSGKNYLEIRRGVSNDQLKNYGYDADQLQKELLS